MADPTPPASAPAEEPPASVAKSVAQAAAPHIAPEILNTVESVGISGLAAGLDSLTLGGSPRAAAAAIAGTAAAAAANVAGPMIETALSGVSSRIDALETAAGDAVAAHPVVHGIVALLAKMFPHEVSGLQSLLTKL